jgi:DNA processing protein
VPGSPLDPRAEGTNDLLKQGASLVTQAADVVAALEPILGATRVAACPAWRAEEPDRGAPPTDADPDAGARERILTLLGPTPVSLDDLVRLAQCPPGIVRTVLLELELAGRLERHGGAMVSLLSTGSSMG